MVPDTETRPSDRSARLVARRRELVLHLGFDGTDPPTALLDELASAGWRDARPSPPPASAIDWSRPDVARGLRYSLRPWAAVAAPVLALAGEDDVPAASARVTELLDRHGFGDGGHVGGGPSAPTAVHLVVTVDEGQAPSMRARLAHLGPVLDEQVDQLRSVQTFRGNRIEVLTTVVRMQLAVPADDEATIVAELAGHSREISRSEAPRA